jgi:hypothetical protein
MMVGFGYPTFSPQVVDSFPRFFEVADRAFRSLDALVTRGYPECEPVQKVILNLGILAGISAQELMVLAGNGFGLGAMKIARTLLETAINAEYLRLFPDECDDYLDWLWVERYKRLIYIRENMPERLSDLSDTAGTETGFMRVRSRFLRANGDLRGSWCRLDLGARAAKTGFKDSYKLINPMASCLIHGTLAGLAMHSLGTQDDARIAVPPSLNFCKESLSGAHSCLLQVVDTLSKTFLARPEPSLDQLVEDYKFAWIEPAKA